MPPSSRHDPLSGFNIQIEINGIAAAGFSECSGLSSETDVVEYREGGDRRVRLLPGLTRFGRIVLRRGITADRALWDWRQTVVNGTADRRSRRRRGPLVIIVRRDQRIINPACSFEPKIGDL